MAGFCPNSIADPLDFLRGFCVCVGGGGVHVCLFVSFWASFWYCYVVVLEG